MGQAEPKSPRILHLAWGRIEVEGFSPFKDAKVFPGGAREWDWSAKPLPSAACFTRRADRGQLNPNEDGNAHDP